MKSESNKALPRGSDLADFTVEKVLETSSAGATYLVRPTDSGAKPVMIREYLPVGMAERGDDGISVEPVDETAEFKKSRGAFLDDARLLQSIEHPNLLPPTGTFEANGTAYMVLPHADGETLEAMLGQQDDKALPGLPEAELEGLFRSLAHALEKLHDAGLMHRAITPGAVFIRADGKPFLIDFGSGHHSMDADHAGPTEPIAAGYAALEVYDGPSNQGPWTDIYALGAVLYRAVTGRQPPEATTRAAAVAAGARDPLRPAVAAGELRYSRRFLEVIDRALAVDPTDRPLSIAEWQEPTDAMSEDVGDKTPLLDDGAAATAAGKAGAAATASTGTKSKSAPNAKPKSGGTAPDARSPTSPPAKRTAAKPESNKPEATPASEPDGKDADDEPIWPGLGLESPASAKAKPAKDDAGPDERPPVPPIILSPDQPDFRGGRPRSEGRTLGRVALIVACVAATGAGAFGRHIYSSDDRMTGLATGPQTTVTGSGESATGRIADAADSEIGQRETQTSEAEVQPEGEPGPQTADPDAQRQAEEAARQAAELEAQREADEAARQAAELEAQREAEEAARQAAELAAQREVEEAARQAAELAAQREAEEAAELAAQRKAEEAARQAERAAQAKAAEAAAAARQKAAEEKAAQAQATEQQAAVPKTGGDQETAIGDARAAAAAARGGDFDQAIRLYGRAIESASLPKRLLIVAHNNRGNLYLRKKSHAAAIEDFDTAITLKPDYVNAYINRGNAYSDQQVYDRGIADFTRAIELKPDEADAYFNRCIAFGRTGKREEAIRDCRKTIELNPDDNDARTALRQLGVLP